jgi:hypothetical protein
MNVHQEAFNQKWEDHYLGIIKEIDSQNKNGIYKVLVYPMYANIQTDFLPPAFSLMTNKSENDPLVVGDIVWCRMQNFDAHFPIIECRANVKNQFPKGSDGQQPDWFSDITANSDISESTVSFEGEYPTIYAKDFGDNIHILFDEKNQVLIVKTDKGYMILDKNGDLHLNINNVFLTSQNNFNVDSQTMKLKIGNNTIVAENEDVTINNNLKILNS